MALDMRGRSLVTDADFSAEEYWQVFDNAAVLKRQVKRHDVHPLLRGKTLAMIFQKPSTRTRVSFEVGMYQLGGTALYLGPNDLQLKRGETIADTAKVLGRYVDGIMARVFKQNNVVEMARHAGVPVINGLSDELHPCQMLTDLFTIWEKRGHFEGLTLAYIGDGNNVAASLAIGCATVGMNMTLITPKNFRVSERWLNVARERAKVTGAIIHTTDDPAGVQDANVIYTNVWTSMGKEGEHDARQSVFRPYQVNQPLVSRAKSNVLVMHCLPAHRGQEITDEVVDGPRSVVFDQAENRLHTQKAIMALVM